ncbi:MAG: hypothetical protein KIT88_01560 [Phycisphaeraceae bacterium]|nr:hypothetical protein [Phycisphaeraceae bacterium]
MQIERPFNDGTFISLRRTVGAKGNEQTLRRLRAEVAGKPEHPLWQELNTLERTLSKGPDTTDSLYWFFNKDHWRVSQDEGWRSTSPWVDTVLRGRDAWRLVPQTLTVGRAGSNTLPPQSNPAGPIETYVRILLTCGIGGSPDRAVDDVRRDGDRWVARLANQSRTEISELTGRIEEGELVVETVVTLKHSDAKWIGYTYSFVPDSDRLLPRLIEGIRPSKGLRISGQVEHVSPATIELIELRDLHPEESITTHLRTPSLEAGDSVRSLNQLTGIIDHNSGTVNSVTDGLVLPNEVLRLSPSAGQSRWVSLVQNSLVVVVLGAIVALILKVRKKGSSRGVNHA